MELPGFFDRQLLAKREELIAKGIDPYPYEYNFTHNIQDIIVNSRKITDQEESVSTIGRVGSVRKAGKALFLDLRKDKFKIQLYIRSNDVDENVWYIVTKLDIGDIIKAQGKLFFTKMGELTINVSSMQLLCKAIVRIPFGKETEDKEFYKAEDPEIVYRERYVYWNIKPEAKQLIEKRFKIIGLIKRWMENEGFLEVQTPTIEMVYGGAEARPFKTNIWALNNQNAYLRISPELNLKKYVAGGFDKVFTVCQNFRNEGIDKSHNPEFTMMEWYEAGTDYLKQMERFENLTEYLVKSIHGATKICYQGVEIDFKTPWRRLTVIDALRELASIDVEKMGSEELISILKEREIEFPENAKKGVLIAILFEELCEDYLIQPTFILDHPFEISPLTKEKRGNEALVERFEPFVNKMEIGNAYSEMTDPVIQFQRFYEQRNQAGVDGEIDYENHPIDWDFIKAVGVGLPPTGGVGYGVDRVIMLILNAASIRDIIPFPLMKPKL